MKVSKYQLQSGLIERSIPSKDYFALLSLAPEISKNKLCLDVVSITRVGSILNVLASQCSQAL